MSTTFFYLYISINRENIYMYTWLNAEASIQILCQCTEFLWRFLSINDQCNSPLLKNWCPGRGPSFTCPHCILRSLEGPAVVATAFAPAALPIPTSAATVISSEVVAAVAVVDLAAADILAAADEFGAADLSATFFTGHFFKTVDEM
jgi:hypothetical protein